VKGSLGRLSVDGGIILISWNRKKCDMWAWTGFICLRIEIIFELL
jgi:hypothetical protein